MYGLWHIWLTERERDGLSTEIAKRISQFRLKVRDIVIGMGEIPKEVYDLTKPKLDHDLDQLNVEISKLVKNSSNQVSDLNRIILTCCKLSDLWVNETYEKRQNLQKLAFPDGVIWDIEIQKPRTITENEAPTVLHSVSSTYKKRRERKNRKILRFFRFSRLHR